MIKPHENARIVVVDRHPDDYENLARTSPDDRTKVEFLNSGRAALRLRGRVRPGLWIINMDLPDMSGLDLQSMLHGRYPDTPVYMVGDDYSPQDEISARSSGATMYFCKPVQKDWVIDSSKSNVADTSTS